MDDARFKRIAEEGQQKLSALFSPFVGVKGGQPIAYNAYLGDYEVVVVGYHYTEAGHTYTKPVAILVDEDLFEHIRVDEETGRVDKDGKLHEK